MVRAGRPLRMITAIPVMVSGDSGPAVCFPAEEPCSPTQRISLGQPLLPANPGIWAGAELGFRYSWGIFAVTYTSKLGLHCHLFGC